MEKQINYKSLQVDGINTKDAPDFVDAFFVYGEYEDGTELPDSVLEALTEDRELVYNLVIEHLY